LGDYFLKRENGILKDFLNGIFLDQWERRFLTILRCIIKAWKENKNTGIMMFH